MARLSLEAKYLGSGMNRTSTRPSMSLAGRASQRTPFREPSGSGATPKSAMGMQKGTAGDARARTSSGATRAGLRSTKLFTFDSAGGGGEEYGTVDSDVSKVHSAVGNNNDITAMSSEADTAATAGVVSSVRTRRSPRMGTSSSLAIAMPGPRPPHPPQKRTREPDDHNRDQDAVHAFSRDTPIGGYGPAEAACIAVNSQSEGAGGSVVLDVSRQSDE